MRGSFLLITLVAALVFGCMSTASAEQVVLRWQSANHAEPQIIPLRDRLIAEFEAANPDIRIEKVIAPRADDWTRFVTSAQAGQTPDIYDAGIPELSTAAYQGWLRPMDDLLTPKDVEPYLGAILEAGQSDGMQYGWPFWGGAYATFYNRQMLAEAGLDENDLPETWDEYLDWMKRLTRDTNNDGIVDQFGMAEVFGRTDTSWRHHLIWLWTNGGDMLNSDMTRSRLAEPEAIEALRFRTDLYLKHGVVPPGPTSYEYVEVTNAFAFERVASMIEAQWAIAKIEIDNPGIAGRYVIGPIPRRVQDATFSLVNFMTIGRDCKHPEEAMRFIRFMNSRENVLERTLVAKWLPFRTDVINDPEVRNDPQLGRFADLMLSAKAYPVHPNVTEMINIGIDMVQDVLTGRRTPEEAAVVADREINRLLQ